jgi:hypothetical protein
LAASISHVRSSVRPRLHDVLLALLNAGLILAAYLAVLVLRFDRMAPERYGPSRPLAVGERR